MSNPLWDAYGRLFLQKALSYGADLYGYWMGTPKSWNQLRNQSILAGALPVVNSYYKVRDTESKYRDYYKNQPYAGFPKYPSLTDYAGVYTAFAGSAINFVSDNVGRLYHSK